MNSKHLADRLSPYLEKDNWSKYDEHLFNAMSLKEGKMYREIKTMMFFLRKMNARLKSLVLKELILEADKPVICVITPVNTFF